MVAAIFLSHINLVCWMDLKHGMIQKEMLCAQNHMLMENFLRRLLSIIQGKRSV